MVLSRRGFFTRAGLLGAAAVAPLQAFHQRSALGLPVLGVGYGALVPDPAGRLDLPLGFQYTVFSQTGQRMSDGNSVPAAHDGMAAFVGPRGTTILIRNHELSAPLPGVIVPPDKFYDPRSKGGTTTLVVNRNRQLVAHFASLGGTNRNCAGGATPWGSWISCEEDTSNPGLFADQRHGYNFEVSAMARGPVDPVPLIAMGRFNHEGVAVDSQTGIVYQTEDQGDSLFYRFRPTQAGNLAAGGILECLRIPTMPQVNTRTGFPVGVPMAVDWVRIEEPNPAQDTVRAEGFAKGAAQFSRGEGIAYAKGEVYFCCTSGGSAGLGQVWRYLPGADASQGGTIELFIEPNNPSLLDSPDNLTIAPFGDLFVCEDGSGTQYVVGITPEGELYQFARNALNNFEFAGATFSPDGQTLFLNIQTPGLTFAIWGPW
ncbi:alkaline phosphatase PhoX [Candidatus Cyanaurora vandensis]|uniref:alkaline phosphatase PhoX n=1 Tax=Candidatus Cyanaurora vandensis TaxID=2714958 RepID=UPI00257F107D|nr:alkaline phosphatase PhoX [Candidatus Cyanaurora vandensis]